ncbi:hypothetical protein DFH07DRAFT_780972 [Mycena maculata]|uniref:Uncharacterized protein n=1 Tax=Mycena maculata TaxID=230809 RepID=A0AAD7I0M2_9AGAR|nr:hypothetical protein DFH07DRAFT_780972 [Mycena maculata]
MLRIMPKYPETRPEYPYHLDLAHRNQVNVSFSLSKKFEYEDAGLVTSTRKVYTPFPAHTGGFLYFGPQLGLPPLAASVRFRCTPTANPSSFDDGFDLLMPNGLPWQKLLPLHSFSSLCTSCFQFTLHNSSQQLNLTVVTKERVHSIRIPYIRFFTSRQYRFEGSALAHFELSPTIPNTVHLRIVKILEPVSVSGQDAVVSSRVTAVIGWSGSPVRPRMNVNARSAPNDNKFAIQDCRFKHRADGGRMAVDSRERPEYYQNDRRTRTLAHDCARRACTRWGDWGQAGARGRIEDCTRPKHNPAWRRPERAQDATKQNRVITFKSAFTVTSLSQRIISAPSIHDTSRTRDRSRSRSRWTNAILNRPGGGASAFVKNEIELSHVMSVQVKQEKVTDAEYPEEAESGAYDSSVKGAPQKAAAYILY